MEADKLEKLSRTNKKSFAKIWKANKKCYLCTPNQNRDCKYSRMSSYNARSVALIESNKCSLNVGDRQNGKCLLVRVNNKMEYHY
jgi:hypothetical protein